MKTHPIIFSTKMVQAILEGRKTMTRRVVKPQPYFDEKFNLFTWDGPRPKAKKYTGSIASNHLGSHLESLALCGKYQPGDMLWVRESFRLSDFPEKEGKYEYRANMENPYAVWNTGIWKPSIHMPKTACRLFLEVASIRVERLHDITDEDAKMEGIEKAHDYGNGLFSYKNYSEMDVVDWELASLSFMTLWESINGKESWNSNPWVWVIEFKKCDKPKNF